MLAILEWKLTAVLHFKCCAYVWSRENSLLIWKLWRISEKVDKRIQNWPTPTWFLLTLPAMPTWCKVSWLDVTIEQAAWWLGLSSLLFSPKGDHGPGLEWAFIRAARAGGLLQLAASMLPDAWHNPCFAVVLTSLSIFLSQVLPLLTPYQHLSLQRCRVTACPFIVGHVGAIK